MRCVLRQLGIAVVVGVIMTTAVAWVSVWREPTPAPAGVPSLVWGQPRSPIGTGRCIDIVHVEITPGDDFLVAPTPPLPFAVPTRFWDNPHLLDGASGTRVLVAARGWPWPALWSMSVRGPPEAANATRGNQPPSEDGLVDIDVDRSPVPLRIAWLGFTLDAALYATLWLLLVATAGVLRRRRRPLRIAAALLAGGVATTVITAWLIGGIVPNWANRVIGPTVQTTPRGVFGGIDRADSPGRVLITRNPEYFRNRLATPMPAPSWAMDWLDADDRTTRSIVASGWPAMALWWGAASGYDADGQPTQELTGAIPLPEQSTNGLHALPLHPLWFGLTLNTALGAMMWAILLAIPFAWRDRRVRRRIRRGLCGRCGYDLRDSTDGCPECGAAVTPTA